MITQEFDINLIPGGVPPQVHASQYDDGSRKFIAHVFDGATRFKLDNSYTVYVVGTKPNMKGFRLATTIEDGAVCFVPTNEITADYGNAQCSLEITKNEEIIHSLVFMLNIAKAALSHGTKIDTDDYDQPDPNCKEYTDTVAQNLISIADDDDGHVTVMITPPD